MDTRPNNLDIQFEQLQEPINGFRGFSIEALNLLIELEQNRRLLNDERPFNCYVYELKQAEDGAFDATELQEAITEFAENVNTKAGPARLQLIIKNSNHYTGLDIQIARKRNECLILDAASDLRRFVIINRLNELKKANGKPLFKRIYCPAYENHEDLMQVDIMSCPVFSFDHVCQSSKLDIFKELGDSLILSRKKAWNLTWMDMPPELVWNAQSMNLLDAYREHNLTKYFGEASARGLAFEKYLINGQALLLLPRTVGYKFQNHSIQRLFESYRDIYLAYRQVDLPSRSLLGEERLSRQNLDFYSMSLPAKLSRIVHKDINDHDELIKKMRSAITMEDFKLLALQPVNSDRLGFFKKSANLYSLKSLCKAIIKNDEDKINKIYAKLFGEYNIKKRSPTLEASSSNLNQ